VYVQLNIHAAATVIDLWVYIHPNIHAAATRMDLWLYFLPNIHAAATKMDLWVYIDLMFMQQPLKWTCGCIFYRIYTQQPLE